MTATIKVIYVYEFNYYGASEDFGAAFGQFGSDTEVFDGRFACGNRSGTMDTHFFCGIPIGQTITRAIGSWDARPTDGLGGWTLSDHHAYDPVERALHRGDGSTTRAEALPPIVKTLAGTRPAASAPAAARAATSRRTARPPTTPTSTTSATTCARRTATCTSTTGSTATTSSVSAATASSTCSRATAKGGSLSGDGGPAKDAGLGTVQALAAAPDGALIIASYDNDNDTRASAGSRPDGSKIETIAGTTNRQAPLGDGKPAQGGAHRRRRRHDRRARRHDLLDRALQPGGNWKGRLRKLAPDGS